MLGAIFKYGITGLFLLIDGIVYFLVAQLFDLYEVLAGSQILTNDFISDVATRMYVVIGIFMLFVVTYSLLKALVNPDNIKDTGKMATNIIISIVLLSIVPTIFFYARELQTMIIKQNVIGRLVLEDREEVNFASEGSNIALTMLEAFLDIPDDAKGEEGNFWTTPLKIARAGAAFLLSGGEIQGVPTWGEFKGTIKEGRYGGFLHLGLFADQVVGGKDTNYIPIISTICGGFMVYCLISFCLDLGVRVIKLGFYQIIAPIPIMMRLIPNKKNVFDNWIKATLATYMEVFIRIFVMVLIVFLTSSIFKLENLALTSDVGIFGLIIIVLGLFAFAKQAPKLISNVIGIDSGNLKLGIGGKLDASGPLGKGINYIGKGTFGALTGGLGGAFGAAVNGASGATGFLYGAINGWKGKKGQFNRQRQDVYSNVLDQKGTAGWFGGRGFIDTQKEKNKKQIQDAYLESEKAKINSVETSSEFRQRQNELRADAQNNLNLQRNDLAQRIAEELQKFESDKMTKIKELFDKLNQEQQVFESDKQRKMQKLQLDLERARNEHDVVNQSKLLKELENLSSSTYSNPELQHQIAAEQNKTSNATIDSLRAQMNALSIDEEAILKQTRTEFSKSNAKYKASNTYVAQKAAEKAAKEWRETHAEEAAIQQSIYENAFKSASKGGSVAGFGGKTGGSGSSSSGGSSGSSKAS